MKVTLRKIIKRKKKNNKGSMVLLLIILSALTSVVGLSFYKVIHSMHKSQITRNKFTQYHLLTLSLRSIMSHPDVCTSALQNQIFDPSQPKSNVLIESSIFEEKKFIGNTQDISNSRFTLINKGFTTNKLLTHSSENFDTYKANLQVWFPNTEASVSFNYERLNLSIPLYVNIDKNNNIKNCYGVYSQAALCERYWKSWNQAENNLDIKCNPDRQCILYTDSSCKAPAIRIAMGGHSVTMNGHGGYGGYAVVGRGFDRMNRKKEDIKNGVEAMEDTLQKLKDNITEMEKARSNIESSLAQAQQALAQAQQALAQAQAAAAACAAACAACTKNCGGCNCSGAAAAVAAAQANVDAAQANVDHLQGELDALNDQITSMQDAVDHMTALLDMGSLILAKAEYEILKTRYNFAMTNPDISPTGLEKLAEEVSDLLNDLKTQGAHIEKTYSIANPWSTVGRAIADPKDGSILDFSAQNKQDIKAEADKFVSGTIKAIGLNPDKDYIKGENNIGKSPNPNNPNKPGVTKAPAILYAMYDHQTNATTADPSSQATSPPGFSYSLPPWRGTAQGFKDNTGTFITRSNTPAYDFHSFFGSHHTVHMVQSQSSVQSKPEYMCLWCNEKRLEQIKKPGQTDPVLDTN